MKANKLFAGVLAALALVACNPNNTTEEVTGITLDQPQAEVEVGQTVTLVATLQPEGVKGDITWESSKPEVATVDQNGVVTGVAEGTSYVAAKCGGVSAFCLVTVKPEQKPDEPKELHPSLTGSNYYIIQLDEESANAIADKVVVDFRPSDDVFLDVWAAGETLAAGETSGLNFYGLADGWVSFTVVAPAGWSGGGYRCTNMEKINKMAAFMSEPDKYYFHIALKSTDAVDLALTFYGNTGEYNFLLDKDADQTNGYGFTRDGEWNELEIPLTFLLDHGITFSENTQKEMQYILGFTGGAVQGRNFQFDAAFFYKK